MMEKIRKERVHLMNFFYKIKQQLEQRKLWEPFVYLFFGGLTTVVNLIVHFLFLEVFHVHYMVATVISWIAAVIFAYVTNKRWVFDSKTESGKETNSEFARFIFYRLLSLAMDALSMYLLISVFQFGNVSAKFITQILVVIANYIFSKFLIFTKKN